MPYTNSPATSAIDRIRLTVGDVYADIELLTDDVYDYLLTKHSNNENSAAVEAARYILFQLARFGRERTGDIEVFSETWVREYRKNLMAFLKDPSLSGVVAVPYAGGVSRADMQANYEDQDVLDKPIYTGFQNPLPAAYYKQVVTNGQQFF